MHAEQAVQRAMDDLVIHEAKGYYLIEVCSPAVLELLREDECLIERVLDAWSESARETGAHASIISSEDVEPPASPSRTWHGAWRPGEEDSELEDGASPWRDNPASDTWQAAGKPHQTDQFEGVDVEKLREKVKES